MLPTAGGHSFQVRRTFQGHDVIGESREGFLVLANGKRVTPSLGMDRGTVDLSDPAALRDCGIVCNPSPAASRAAAGAKAPANLGHAAEPGKQVAIVPDFERRTGPSPGLPGARELADAMNTDPRGDAAVLADLKSARRRFGGLVAERKQTGDAENHLFLGCVKPMLNGMNARSPGLDAIGCTHEDQMVAALRRLSGNGPEGHVRFHLGMVANIHSLAVDAYRHADGRFTLVAVDSISKEMANSKMADVARKHPDLVRGAMVIPTPNQAHTEGCRIFAAHSLEAMRDYQPYIRDLHKGIAARAEGKPVPPPAPDAWKEVDKNVLALKDPLDAFGVLAGKFFKHIQVLKPPAGRTTTLLDEAEARNPDLKTAALNKQGETLRARVGNQNPEKALEEFERFDRTSSTDRKRLVLLDRAIEHYAAKTAN